MNYLQDIINLFMSKLNYSTTTRDDNDLSRTRGVGFTNELSVSQRSVSPSYQRLPMYTFSPNDRRNENQYSSVSRGARNDRSHTLVQSEVRSPRQIASVHIEAPRYSMSAGTRSAMISKLRQMGQGIDQLMQRSTSASQELTASLLHLKDLIEDVFCQVTAELQDLKAENYQLRAEGVAAQQGRIRQLQEHYQYKIADLEAQKSQLQASLKRMQNALERSEGARDELARKAKQTEQISRDLSRLENQRDANRATINRLNAKISDLVAEKQQFKKKVNSQGQILNEIKSEAKNVQGVNRNLERRLDEAEGEIVQLQREIELLDRKNRQLEKQADRLDAERQKILKQSKQDMAELSDVRDENKNLTRQLQSIMAKLKDQSQHQNQLKAELDSYKRELDGERRKTGELKQASRRQQEGYQSSLNAEREKLSRRLQDEENKYRDAEKRLGDQLRKSDLIESELDKYRKELENERRRSNVLESEYQNRNKEFQNERDGLLGRLDEEKRNFKKQAGVLGDYTQRLGKSEDLLKEFARQSDLQERQLRGLRQQMEDERRRSSLAEEQAVKKLKDLASQNDSLHRRAGENQQNHKRALDAMRDYENKYKDAERRFADETRKSELNEKKIRDLLAEMDETRRLSQLDAREKAELIRKIQNKNDQLSGQIKEEQDDFKKKQADFFNKNKQLERVLQQNARRSDMLAQEMLQLKNEYENERRKSLTYEQEQKQLNAKMRELGDKYAGVAQKLQESKDIYKNKQELYRQLDKKHKQIEKVLLDQTRKSQMDEEQLKMLHDQIERERRKSAAFEQESVNKIKDLLGKNDGLAGTLREQQAKHDKAAELMRRAEERARQLEREGEEWRRKSDMFAAQSGRFRDELDTERRRSMAMEAEHENRLKAMEKKNIELMRKLDEDRDRLGKSGEALKQAEIKYAKIQQILDDERRASQMSQVQLKKLADDFENERRQSSAFEADAQRKLEELARRNRQIEQDAEDLEERLSISNKTVRTLQTKASNAEKSADELSRLLDNVNEQKLKSDELAKRYKEEINSKDAVIRKEREERENALRDLKTIENRMRETDTQIRQMTQAHQSLLRQINEKEKQLAESNNSNEYLASSLNDLKTNERKLNERVDELYRVNVENAATFEKNYQTLKSQISHRDRNNEEKEKKIQVLEKQVIQDSKRVIAINPSRNPEPSRDIGNPYDYIKK